MSNVDKQIRASIDSFVLELHTLVRQAAVEAVQEALGTENRRVRRLSRRGPKADTPSDSASSRAGRRRRLKRSAQALAKLESTLLSEITRNPGQRMEAIGKKLGVSTKELILPIKKLVESKQIKKRGEKRATEYLPA